MHSNGNELLTNEEQRVPNYHEQSIPTRPETVNIDTSLESLNLNWRERDLPERVRTKHVHRLHPYLGKFIPQLIEIFLRKYFKKGQKILDPFCGSGTTLVQANELGISAIGCDISAFNVLLCQAKTERYDLNEVSREVNDILDRMKNATHAQSNQRTLWGQSLEKPDLILSDDDYLKKWFATTALDQLLTYRYFIEHGDYEYKDLLKIILSRSARSARLTTHFDLDFPKKPQTEPYWCYKHGRTCQPTTDALQFLKRYSIDTIRRIQEFSEVRTDAKVRVIHGDSRTVKFPRINGVITSPPYVGLIDYHEQHAYAYRLLGLVDRRDEEIGAAANGSSKKAQVAYQKSIADVFVNAARSMPKGSRMIVIAGDRCNLYDGIADLLNVEVEGKIDRHVNRRTGRRSSEFFESIFIWKKC